MVFDGDRLIEFASDDRPDSSRGHPVGMRWRTPVDGFAMAGELRLPTGGSAVYDRADGPFEYAIFQLRDAAYDVRSPAR